MKQIQSPDLHRNLALPIGSLHLMMMMIDVDD